MPSKRDQPFTPPSADQVQRHLDRHPPRGPSRLSTWLPLAALGAAAAMTFMTNEYTAGLLPWLLLGGVIFFMGYRVSAMRNLEQRVARVQELTILRHLPQSLRLAWRLLPDLSTIPELHGRTVALIADNLDRLGCHDAAIVAYDYLIERLPPNQPGSVHLRIHRTMVQLSNEQLTDADDSLRRLRAAVDEMPGTPVSAGYRLAQLIQRVQTNHFDEAVNESDNLLEELRPLGIEAGYGHALMALSCFNLEDHEAAQTWWSSATLLLPPATLTRRFNQLQSLSEQLTANQSSPPPTE